MDDGLPVQVRGKACKLECVPRDSGRSSRSWLRVDSGTGAHLSGAGSGNDREPEGRQQLWVGVA